MLPTTCPNNVAVKQVIARPSMNLKESDFSLTALTPIDCKGETKTIKPIKSSQIIKGQSQTGPITGKNIRRNRKIV